MNIANVSAKASEQLADKAHFVTIGGGGTVFIGGISASTLVAICGGVSVILGLALQFIRSARDKERRNEERDLHALEMQIKRKQLENDSRD
ncbi:MAG: hypothetical protein ACI9SP_004577 [Arenicella sp.]|jgi:hypothetical protein